MAGTWKFGAAVESSPWLQHGKLITLRAEMFAGKTGIGHPYEDGFRRVFPADYKPPQRKRDGSEKSPPWQGCKPQPLHRTLDIWTRPKQYAAAAVLFGTLASISCRIAL